MTYEPMKDWKPGHFKRACGVHPQTFETLVQELLCVAVGKGREHDVKLCKRSHLFIDAAIECRGDKGYQGIQNCTPIAKRPRRTRAVAR
jgi:hypothetical protein